MRRGEVIRGEIAGDVENGERASDVTKRRGEVINGEIAGDMENGYRVNDVTRTKRRWPGDIQNGENDEKGGGSTVPIRNSGFRDLSGTDISTSAHGHNPNTPRGIGMRRYVGCVARRPKAQTCRLRKRVTWM